MRSNLDIGALDRASVLHPFTQLREFASGASGGPTIVETASGVRIRDADGHDIDQVVAIVRDAVGQVLDELVHERAAA